METIPNLSGLEKGDRIIFMPNGHSNAEYATVAHVFLATNYCTMVDLYEDDGKVTRIDFHLPAEKVDKLETGSRFHGVSVYRNLNLHNEYNIPYNRGLTENRTICIFPLDPEYDKGAHIGELLKNQD